MHDIKNTWYAWTLYDSAMTEVQLPWKVGRFVRTNVILFCVEGVGMIWQTYVIENTRADVQGSFLWTQNRGANKKNKKGVLKKTPHHHGNSSVQQQRDAHKLFEWLYRRGDRTSMGRKTAV
jgi:hypothetical protein